ncbi:hypothetical protein [Pseudomonas sp. dw_358]|uniref:hypothetical protein n=1 Tax=Pseudomonas sp. dw_358 TaxID=2720083 RepID=UPI001BD2A0EC|nr:hypothetical protein [Pseudomonas sp. dw_358]
MTPERFAQLADAYGANLQRWPDAEREAARRLLDAGDGQLLATWQRASWLDGQLDSYQLPVADPALARTIIASAPAPRVSFWSSYSGWLSRAGLLGAGLAGLATGMLLVSLSMPLTPSGDNEALPSVFDHSDLEMIYGTDPEEAEQ